MKKPKKVNKTWGYELWLANNQENNYCGKILYIKEGYSTSMHFHANKHETFYVFKGMLKVDVIDTSIADIQTHMVVQGETFEVSRNVPHKLIAMHGPVEFIEISTFHEDRDSYRIWR